MKHIRKFENHRNKRRRDEIIKESVLQVNDVYKVRALVDIPQSLINAYVKKVKDQTGKNLRQFFGDVDIAEEVVKYINTTFLNVDQIPGGALTGEAQPGAQGQGQIPGAPGAQAPAQAPGAPQAQGDPMAPQAQPAAAQGELPPQAQAQAGAPAPQAQTQVAPQAQAQAGAPQVQVQAQPGGTPPQAQAQPGPGAQAQNTDFEDVSDEEEPNEEDEELPL